MTDSYWIESHLTSFARRKWTSEAANVWFELFQEEAIGIMTDGVVAVSRREWVAAIRPDKETETDG